MMISLSILMLRWERLLAVQNPLGLTRNPPPLEMLGIVPARENDLQAGGIKVGNIVTGEKALDGLQMQDKPGLY